MSEVVQDRASNGQFLPGNTLWNMHAFKKGHKAYLRLKLTPQELHSGIGEYLEWCQEGDRYPNVGHLATWLCVHRDTIQAWRNGESTTEQGRALSVVIERYYAFLQGNVEECFMSGEGNQNGRIFWARNTY